MGLDSAFPGVLEDFMGSAKLIAVGLLVMALCGCSSDSQKQPPGTPLGLTATPGDGQVTLNWQADPEGIRTGVYVWQGEQSDNLAERDFISAPATEYLVTGLVNDVTYHFALEAADSRGARSKRSATVAATPLADIPPVPPKMTDTFLALPGDGQVVLSWTFALTRSVAPKGIHLFWGTDPGDLDQTVFVDYPGTAYTVGGLDNGQDYGFAAEVEDQDGVRSERTEVQVVRPFEYDTTGPTILATSPADGATGVDPEALLSVTFSESMKPSSVEIIPDPGRALRTFQWNADGSELVTGPQLTWQEGETYWVKVTGTDRWGNPIEGVDVFSFTVGYESLTPGVTGFSPDDGLGQVPTNSRISVTFGEAMQPISTQRALSVDPDVPLSYEVDERQQTFTWTPQTPLQPDTTYTVTVAPSALSLRGQALASGLSFQFHTGSGPDEIPPSVVSWLPEDGAIGVDRHFEIAIAFSEPMDHAWTQAALVFLTHPGMQGTYTWNTQGTVMRFQPAEDPEHGEVVRWKLLNQAKDLAGNPLGQELISEFQIIRSLEATIVGNGYLDGEVALLSDGGQYGDHWIDTDSRHVAIGNMNYTYLGPAIQRGFYTFELDALPPNLTRITYAEMHFVQQGMWGSCSEIGNFFLESVPYGPALTLDDFDVPVLDVEVCDEQDQCVVQPYIIEGECPQYSTHLLWYAGVTSAIRNDWDDRLARMGLSQWRLRIENELTGATGQTMYFLAADWANSYSQWPRLIVRYEIP